jgi:ubiquinone/menaquinone biosynthesis C-methylase UbiE
MSDDKYFKDGEAYERFMGRWSRVAGEAFIGWLSLPDGLRWLDVGCGTGAFSELVVDRCAPAQVSAVDPAEDQIDYARTRPAAARIDYRIGEAQSLPYDDDAFDVAAMALVIVFLPEPLTAVKEMARVVKPGGTVATYMWDLLGQGFPLHPLMDALDRMDKDVPTLPGYPNTRMDALTHLFEAAGIAEVATRTIEVEVSYANFDDYWASQTVLSHPVVQLIRSMPKGEVEQLQGYLRAHLPTDGAGRIAYSVRANAVKGRVPG